MTCYTGFRYAVKQLGSSDNELRADGRLIDLRISFNSASVKWLAYCARLPEPDGSKCMPNKLARSLFNTGSQLHLRRCKQNGLHL